MSTYVILCLFMSKTVDNPISQMVKRKGSTQKFSSVCQKMGYSIRLKNLI